MGISLRRLCFRVHFSIWPSVEYVIELFARKVQRTQSRAPAAVGEARTCPASLVFSSVSYIYIINVRVGSADTYIGADRLTSPGSGDESSFNQFRSGVRIDCAAEVLVLGIPGCGAVVKWL